MDYDITPYEDVDSSVEEPLGDKVIQHDVEEPLGPRVQVLTEKGKEWHLHILHGRLRESLSRWKRQVSECLVLIADSDDCKAMRAYRSRLVSCFDEVTSVSAAFDRFEESDVSALRSKYEAMENEHMKIMSQLSETIRSLDAELGSTRSSKRSSTSHSSTVRASAVAEAASLKAKLKFIDMEAQKKADLETVETLKMLQMAEAKVAVLDSIEPQSASLAGVEQLPQDDNKGYVGEYIRSLSMPCIQTEYLHGDGMLTAPLAGPNSEIEQNISVSYSNAQSSHGGDVIVHTAPVSTHTAVPHTTSSFPNPLVSQFVPAAPSNTKVEDCVGMQPANQSLVELALSLVDQMSLNRIPPPEPNVFNGDPIQYPAWKAAFNLLIDRRNIPAGERLHYLKRYLGGSVRQIIENYFLVPSDNSYEQARNLLDERFGDSFVVASAFRRKLDRWPRIQSRDASGLVKFGDFLKQCLMAMQTIPCLRILDDCLENRKMLAKVPDWIVVRWNRIAASHKETNKEFPSFKTFVDFINKEAKIASDPVTSVQALKDNSWVPSRNAPNPFPSRSSSDVVKGPGHSFLSASREDGDSCKVTGSLKSEGCILCKKSHGLDTCKLFLDKSMEDRKAFIKEKGLCFGCLQKGHISRKCRQRKTCKVCSKLHPSSLHGDRIESMTSKTKSDEDISPETKVVMGTSFLNSTGLASKCSAIVPVYLSHSSDPDRERLVYALLDSQSDTTFALKETCEAIGVCGMPVKLSLSTMLSEETVVGSERINGLLVRGYNSGEKILLPSAYTRTIMPANRSHIPTPKTAEAWPHLEHMSSKLIPLQSCEIGLLIGYNCSRALMPREIIPPVGDGPYGQRTDLGWSVVGVVQHGEAEEDSLGLSHRVLACEIPSTFASQGNACAHSVMFSLRTSVKEIVSGDILRIMERDFCDADSTGAPLSQDDKQFLSILNKGICFRNGRYEMPLPFKNTHPDLPNNRSMALNRLRSLQKRLQSDGKFRSHYSLFMNNLIRNGYAERVPEQSVDRNPIWYIPHHGVYHHQKPDKIRVVFDCSAVFRGQSLNQHLLQGPDLTNKLVGVLCRFRKEPVAFMCDVEQMFYQFGVTADCKDYLRFLWWETEDVSSLPVDFRMTVHLFGASSSPGCANFGLKQFANDNASTFGSDVCMFIHRDFYVDDGLLSLPTTTQAVDLIGRIRAMCQNAGLRLHTFVSNSKEVIQSVPLADRAEDMRNIDLMCDKLPVERALGIWWCVESDTFQFRIVLKERPLTRRGILSSVSCLYDPLGLIAPVVLVGKQILQQMCSDKADWDDPLPEHLRTKWQNWCDDLGSLSSLKIPRCWKPKDFGEVVSVELHHFSDASFLGYGQCSYVRSINLEQKVHCALVMGKSRVAPLKSITIPRLELVAASLSVKIGNLLQQELDYCDIQHVYWTDSKVVLGYISNESRRFHVFVANRVQQIRDKSEPSQWRYVRSQENPADLASRGIPANALVGNSMWFNGPEFLWQRDLPAAQIEEAFVDPKDPEVKRSQCFLMNQDLGFRFPSLIDRLQYFSNWHHAKRAIALCLRLKSKLCQHAVKKPGCIPSLTQSLSLYEPVSVRELKDAETVICKAFQKECFSEEIRSLRECSAVEIPADRKEVSRRHIVFKSNSRLRQLDPFIDSDGLLRVGGRLENANVCSALKHPIVMPKVGHVTDLLVRHFHEKCFHQGRGMTVNEIRQNGFWVIGCSGVVSTLLSKCIVCRRLRALAKDQKMSDLPTDRLEPAPPFSYCAVDCFGPFYIREGRKELKRYGVLFTCMACRAVHVETANSLDTSSFINSLRRLIAIRGPIRQLRSDRGTNFVGAENELKEAVNELDEEKIRQFLLEQGCDFTFKMNIPSASHMGGVWERQIRSVRNVLSCLLHTHGSQLDDECLRTFLHEAAAIVNCRPLTVENLNDPLSVTPLHPNQLLTMKTKVVLPPPGNFLKEDVYSRKRWRRTQYLVDQFWGRWKLEYLQNLQKRSKWFSPSRNMHIRDVVLLRDDNLPRNQWRLGRVTEAPVDDDGLVRKVKVALADPSIDMREEDESDTKTYNKQKTGRKRPYFDPDHDCDICDYSAKWKSRLALHKRTHTGEKPYKCNMCDYAAISSSYMSSHKRTHKPDGQRERYKCDICERSFKTRSSRNEHVKNHSEDRRRFNCDICKYAANKNSVLQRHMLIHSGIKPFQCDICNVRFTRTTHLTDHKLIHSEAEKPFKCDVCEYACHKKDKLLQHQRVHTGEKPYMCDICGYKCSQKPALDKHKRTHTGEKPYKCNVCDYACIQKITMDKHKKTHTGEKPYMCDTCGYSCIEKYHLVTHIKTHTGDKPYKCDVCGYSFIQKWQLKSHMRKCRGKKTSV